MPSFEFVSDFMYSNLIMTSHSNMNFIARCPFCGDSKKSLKKRRFHLKYINNESIVFNCFNCGASGSFIDLYAHINGIDSKQAWRKLRGNSLDSLKQTLKKEKKVEQKKEVIYSEFSEILKDCISLHDDIDGILKKKYYDILEDFYIKRKISKNIDLYIAYRGQWKNRIIIPIYDGKKMIYFQGRAINNEILPKYKNPVSEKSNIIYNKNNFKKDKYIVITEGILDALSIENQSTVCLGASISDDFLKLIFSYTKKGVIIALDNDGTGIRSTRTIMDNSAYKNQLRYFIMPKEYKHIKDLNELKVNANIDNIYEFVVNNSFDNLKTHILLKCN